VADKICPRCKLPIRCAEKTNEWYTGGWISGQGEEVPLIYHALYSDGYTIDYQAEWEQRGFDEESDIMPAHHISCACPICPWRWEEGEGYVLLT